LGKGKKHLFKPPIIIKDLNVLNNNLSIGYKNNLKGRKMKKCVLLCVCCFAAGFLVMCLSVQSESVIRNDPVLSFTEWKNKKVGVFPSFVSAKSNIPPTFLEENLYTRLVKEKYNVIPATNVKKMISGSKFIEKYETLLKHYQLFNEIDNDAVCEISEKIGLDYILIAIGVVDYKYEDKDGSGYKAETKLFLYNVKNRNSLAMLSKTGESIYYKTKKKPGLLDAMNAFLSDDNPTIANAYSSSIAGTVIKIRGLFVGECISGDCQNGIGVFAYYDYAGNFSKDKYEGAWLDGLAHGKGTMYKWDSSEQCLTKYDGEWALGKLKIMGPNYYLENGNWIKGSPKDKEFPRR
jgi:hypothetical protein